MTAHTFGPQRAIIDTLKARWRLYAVEGVVMIVLGVLAVVFPVFAMLAVDLYLGWVFLLAGLLALAAVLSAHHIPGFWWGLVTAILAIVLGLALLLKPAAGIFSLTAVLVAYFVVKGIFQMAAALRLPRGDPAFLGLAALERPRRPRARGDRHLRLAGTVGWTLGLLAA